MAHSTRRCGSSFALESAAKVRTLHSSRFFRQLSRAACSTGPASAKGFNRLTDWVIILSTCGAGSLFLRGARQLRKLRKSRSSRFADAGADVVRRRQRPCHRGPTASKEISSKNACEDGVQPGERDVSTTNDGGNGENTPCIRRHRKASVSLRCHQRDDCLISSRRAR